MTFKPGASGNPLGKPKGALSKTTIAFKTALILAFEKNGGWKALAKWGKKNPTEFYKLMAKMIPVELTGSDGKDLIPKVIRILVPPAPAPQPELDRFTLNGHVNGTH